MLVMMHPQHPLTHHRCEGASEAAVETNTPHYAELIASNCNNKERYWSTYSSMEMKLVISIGMRRHMIV